MFPGEQYHLYNHANGRENIFVEQKNYDFFLEKMADHILPVCKIYAYCLMPNHFHLVIEIYEEDRLQQIWKKPGEDKELAPENLVLKISKAFANFFSSYTQSFNKVYDRKGSLFIPSMKTQLISDDISFCKVVHYAHANPVHHGFVKSIDQWTNSSYRIFLSSNSTKIERDYVLAMFGGREAFIKYHDQPIDLKMNYLE